MKKITTTFWILICFAVQSFAQVYITDPTFAVDGVAQAAFGNDRADKATNIITQADGKLLIAGASRNETDNTDYIVMSRFAAACGSLDPTFGDGGKVFVQFNVRNYLNGIAEQDDGKIVGVGLEATSDQLITYKPMVCRFNADGSIDETFGTDGHVVLNLGALTGGEAYDVIIQPNGKILVFATVYTFPMVTDNSILVARFNANGTPDLTFNGSGVTSAWTGSINKCKGGLLPDGKIMIVQSAVNHHIALALFNGDGTRDMEFGTDGYLVTGMAYNDPEFDVKLSGDRIFVAYNLEQNIAAVASFNLDGTLDIAFGVNGYAVITSNTTTLFYIKGMTVLPDGKMVIAFRTGFNFLEPIQLAAVQLDDDGDLVNGFGNLGFYGSTLDNGSQQYFTDVTTDEHNNLWFSGIDFGTGNGDFILVKLTQNPGAIPVVDLGADIEVCEGEEVVLDAQVAGVYAWSDGSATQTLIVHAEGVYSVDVVSADGCSGNDEIEVTFNESPHQPVIAHTGNTLTATGAGSFQWFFYGAPVEGATAATINPFANGEYAVMITNTNGCSNMSETYLFEALGVNDVAENNISVYPNPANDVLHINGLPEGATYKLFDIVGRMWIESKQTEGNTRIETANLPAGEYVLLVVDKSMVSQVKINIQH